jgi:hypothetical protein
MRTLLQDVVESLARGPLPLGVPLHAHRRGSLVSRAGAARGVAASSAARPPGPEVADFSRAATIADLSLERLRHALPPLATRSEISLPLLAKAGV